MNKDKVYYSLNGINAGDYYIYKLDDKYFTYYQIIRIIVDDEDGIQIVMNECYPNKNTMGVQSIVSFERFLKDWRHERLLKLKEIDKKLGLSKNN